MAAGFGESLHYLARVEFEVERNVLELLTLLPYASEVDHAFFADVWQGQELRHGLIVDQLQQDLARPATGSDVRVSPGIKLLGALCHLREIHELVRFAYYLTGQ